MRRSLTRALLFSLPLSIAGPASAQWIGSGPVWTAADVGINKSAPTAPLDIVGGGDGPTLLSMQTGVGGMAIQGIAAGAEGMAISGVAYLGSGETIGVGGTVWSTEGKAVAGYSGATSGSPVAIHGEQQGANGYSGFFKGGSFVVEPWSTGFIGLGRDWRINSSEALGVHCDTSSWGGMYMNTEGGGKPYYGYSIQGSAQAYHYFDWPSRQWRLWVGGTRIAVNQQSGRVGIGTLSPAHTLHVNGSAGKPGGGSWANTSDRRLKEEIEPIEGALDRLLSVRGVTYRYIDPKAIHELEGTQLGVIAQEVESAFPGWVDEGDDGYKRVTFRGFEGVTIEALRELRDRNDALAAENEALRARLRAHEEALAAIERRLEAL